MQTLANAGKRADKSKVPDNGQYDEFCSKRLIYSKYT
jgi:hypothetical protein